MTTINGKALVKDGKPLDRAYSNGQLVYNRNFLAGTSNVLKTVNVTGWGKSPTYSVSGTSGAGRYYASAYIENTTPVKITIYVSVYRGGKFFHNLSAKAIPAGQSGVASFTFDIYEGEAIGSAFVGFTGTHTESYTYKYKEVMLKHTPSPWTPAPEDII